MIQTMSVQTNRPRHPGMVLAALAIVLLVVMGVFALTQRQPPPPTIAEFAPQSVESIDDSPDDQSSSSGSGQGTGEGAGGGEPTPAPSDVLNVPRVRKCVGDPPRQIEDPQSPPCVPYWAGDNGGATSKGVTRDEVRIAIHEGYPADDLRAFFNARFEFYGRQLAFKSIPARAESCESTAQQADAASVDEDVDAFASSWSMSCVALHYARELARRGVIYSAAGEGVYTDDDFGPMAPYVWQYPMSANRVFENMGEWACKALAHRPARFASDPAYRVRERKFGAIAVRTDQSDEPVRIAPLTGKMRSCGAEPPVVFDDYISNSPDMGQNAVLRFREAEATTVVCLCHFPNVAAMTKTASSQGYFPEWVVSSYGGFDVSAAISIWFDQGQVGQVLGMTINPRQLRPENEPHRWASREGGGNGEFDPLIYRSLLLIASGIQMAGPRLTPQTFRSGLQHAAFPNPAHPNMAGAVGFGGAGAGNGPTDYSMTNDAATWWFGVAERSPYPPPQPAGSICYVDGAARHSLGTWPQGDDAYFRLPCESGA